jgi:hypothetical protein
MANFNPPWNKGLTKETNIKVKENGEHIHQALLIKPRSEEYRKISKI